MVTQIELLDFYHEKMNLARIAYRKNHTAENAAIFENAKRNYLTILEGMK